MSKKCAYIIKDWSELTPDLAQYDALVCNIGIDQDKLASVVRPDAILLASINATMIPMAGIGNPLMDQLRLLMEPFMLKHNGVPVLSQEYGDPYIDWRQLAGASALASFCIAKWPLTQGIYIDDMTDYLPEHKAKDLPDRSVANYYRLWRLQLVTRLVASGFKYVTANTGGYIDPRLSGICIEGGHVRKLGTLQSLARWAVVRTQGRKPTLSVDWDMNIGKLPLAHSVLGLYEGVRLP